MSILNNTTALQNEQTELQSLLDAVNGLPDAGGSAPVLQSKTVTPTTTQQTVTPDNGYDGLEKVTVNAMPTATQATPSITVSSAGLITASATQTAGYVAAGTKSATQQLTTQGAKNITPSKSKQTAVAKDRYTTGAVTVAAIPNTYVEPTATKSSYAYIPTTSDQTIAAGTYCSGTQTIKGDSNLVAGNIKSGVSIFGVVGSYAGSVDSGGVRVETCTVNVFERSGQNSCSIFVTTIDSNGNFLVGEREVTPDESITINDVVCGSAIVLMGKSGSLYGNVLGEFLNHISDNLFQAPTAAGSEGNIILAAAGGTDPA